MANNFNNRLYQSTNPLAFTTNGQRSNNSLPTVIKSNESSLRVVYGANNKDATSYLTYTCNFTQPSTGTHNLKWTFTPNHNTKGYIKNDGIKINLLGRMPSTTINIDEVEKYGNYNKFGLEEGKGTASNPMPVEGGIIAFNVSGVSYDCARGCNTNRLVTITRYYKFPANLSIGENGTGDKEIEVISNIGQDYTNTYSPSLSLRVSTSDTYLHTYTISRNYSGTKDNNVLNMIVTGPIDYSPYDETRLKHLAYNGTNYAYIDSNLGSVKKGTCSGIYTAYATNARPQANSSRISCSTENLTITQSDNSQAKTNPRRVNLSLLPGNGDTTRDKYKFASFDKLTSEEPYDTVTIYQDGGNLVTPNPSTSISWEWVGDSAINARNWGSVIESRPKTKIINGVSCEIKKTFNYNWNSNTGTNAIVGGTLTSAPSKLTQAENNITKDGSNYVISCPDNTGSEITIELDGHFMTLPRDTSSRSLSGKFLITCENDKQGSIGSLSNEIDSTDIFNRKRKVPFTITQEGQTNPEPSFTIQQKLIYYSTNPDTSVMPTITFNGGQEKAGQATQTHTITTTGTQTILLTIPNTKTSAPQGASVDYKSSTITNSAALKTIPASGGTVDLNVDWNYTIDDFNSGYVPASGEYKWLTYFPIINTPTNVDCTVTNDTVTFSIIQPGNETVETGNYKTVTISIISVQGKDGQQPWGSLSVRTDNNIITNTNSLSCTRSVNSLVTDNRKFVFNAKSNNASISKVSAVYDKNSKLLTVTHNGVSTTNRQGYCNFVKSEGGLQYAGQTEKITNRLALIYNVAGETYGGKITLSASKTSGSGDCGNVRVTNHIDLTTVPTSGKTFSMSDLVTITPGSGNYDSSVFKLPSSVTIPADSTYYGIVCPAVTVTSSTSSTWDVYAKITGTVNSSLNNTFPTGLTNGFIGSFSTPIVTPTIPDNYYFWWDPVSNGNNTTMISNKNEATIYCQPNTGGSGYVASITDYFGNGYWIKVIGGKENKTDSRKLGTLRAGFGTTKANATSSVDVWQAGTGGGNITNSDTFIINFYNCDGYIGDTPAHNTTITTTLSSSSPDDPKSVNGDVNSVSWNKWSNNTSELSLVIYNVSYTGSGTSIGAFDNNINTNIGVSVSNVNIRYPYKVICNGHELSSYSESGGEVSPTYKVTWSDGVTTGLTRNISIAATNPGTYTYSVTKLVVSYTFTNAYDAKSVTVTKEQSLNNSWTFTVDSKHYYNN